MIDPHGLDSMTHFGLIQKISTGSMVFDLVLCFIIPVALKYSKPYLERLWEWYSAAHERARCVRNIKFTKREGYYHYDPSEKNNILQEAILLYIGSNADLVTKFQVRLRCVAITDLTSASSVVPQLNTLQSRANLRQYVICTSVNHVCKFLCARFFVTGATLNMPLMRSRQT
jgi:hypothetical protein